MFNHPLKTPPLKLKIIRSHSVSLQQMLTCTIQIWTYQWNVTVNITNERESLFVRGSNNKAYRNSFVVPTVIFGDGGVTVKGAYRTRALDFLTHLKGNINKGEYLDILMISNCDTFSFLYMATTLFLKMIAPHVIGQMQWNNGNQTKICVILNSHHKVQIWIP